MSQHHQRPQPTTKQREREASARHSIARRIELAMHPELEPAIIAQDQFFMRWLTTGKTAK